MNILWFCIPAFGHTNPTIEVVRELAKRGHNVRYYSFDAFREKIEDAGAVFISCDKYLPQLTQKEEKRIRKASTTEMTLQDIETTRRMDDVLAKEILEHHPDVIVSDSVCFWGKLTAQKYQIPMVCSTTTFAFNRYSSQYLKYSFSELLDTILGTGKIKKALKAMEPLGYHVNNVMELVQNTNDTHTIVYATKNFQPCSDTFAAEYYCFAGPSVKEVPITREENKRPFLYISLGTVINDHPDFYKNCVEAFRAEDIDVLISCGTSIDPKEFEPLPDNIRMKQSVNQMEILGKANLFITHCGMNSASEGLYMGVPELLLPLTGEQQAVARRVQELGAGIYLNTKSDNSPEAIRKAVKEALASETLAAAVKTVQQDFRSCHAPKAAADFIEKCGAAGE